MATYRELLEMDYRNEIINHYYYHSGSMQKLIKLKQEYIRTFGKDEVIKFQEQVLEEIRKQQEKDYRDEQTRRHTKTI